MADGYKSIGDLTIRVNADLDNLSSGLTQAHGVVANFVGQSVTSLGLFDNAVSKVATGIELVRSRIIPWIAAVEGVVAVVNQVWQRAEQIGGALGLSDELTALRDGVDGVHTSAGNLLTAMRNLADTKLGEAREQVAGVAHAFASTDAAGGNTIQTFQGLSQGTAQLIDGLRRVIESFDRIENRSFDTLQQNLADVAKKISDIDEAIASRRERSTISPFEFFSQGTIDDLERQRAALVEQQRKLTEALLPSQMPNVAYGGANPPIANGLSGIIAGHESEIRALERKAEAIGLTAVEVAKLAAEEMILADARAKGIRIGEIESLAIDHYLERVVQATLALEEQAAAKRRTDLVNSFAREAEAADLKSRQLGQSPEAAAEMAARHALQSKMLQDNIFLSDAERASIEKSIAQKVEATRVERTYAEFKKDVQDRARDEERRDRQADQIVLGSDRELETLRQRNALIGLTGGELARAALEERAYAAARLQNIQLTDQQIARIRADGDAVKTLTDAYTRAQTSLSLFRDVGDMASRDLATGWSRFVSGAVRDGASFQQMVAGMAEQLRDLVLKKLIFDQVGNAITTGLTGLLAPASPAAGPGGWVTTVAGARAEGGPVDAGNLYLVGERGPELFRPSMPGTVIPNGAPAGGGGASPVNVHITAPAGTTARETGRQSDGNGMSIDIMIEQIDSALGQRLSDDRSTLGDAMKSRFGLSSAAGAR